MMMTASRSTVARHRQAWTLALIAVASLQAHGIVRAAQAPSSKPPSQAELASATLRVMPDEVVRLQERKSVLLVDVRDTEEYKQGHIDGAASMPLFRLDDHLATLRATRKAIVTYCACPDEMSAARAAIFLRDSGVRNVRALVGGYNKWLADKRPVAVGLSSRESK